MRPFSLFLAAVVMSTAHAGAFEQTWQDPESWDEGLTVEQFALALDELASPHYVVRRRARRRIIERANAEVLFALYQVRDRVIDPETASSIASIIPAVRKKVGDRIFEKDFLILGPFPFPDGLQPKGNADRRDWLELPTGLDALSELNLSDPVPAFPPEKGDADAKDKEDGPKATWQRPYKGQRGVIDFTQLYKDRKEYANALLVTFLYSETERRAELWMGSDDGLAVWINGACVHARDIQRGIGHDSDRVEIALKKGWNPLALRISQGWGGWAFSMRVTDLSGMPWPEKWIDPTAGGEAPKTIPIHKPYHTLELGNTTVKKKDQEVTRAVCKVRLPAHWTVETDTEAARKTGAASVRIAPAHYLDPNATEPATLAFVVGPKGDAKAAPDPDDEAEGEDQAEGDGGKKTLVRSVVVGEHAVTMTLTGPAGMVKALKADLEKLAAALEK